MTPNTEIVELACDRLPGTAGAASAAFSFLLIHGWGRSRSDWMPVAEQLGRIAPVVSVDLRGHGASSPGRDMVLAHVAGDVRALADRLGLTSVVLVAHSAGGEVAAELARQDPRRVVGLVVIDPAFGLPDTDRARIEALAERLRREEPEEVAREHFENTGPSPLLPLLPETGRVLAASPGTVREMFVAFAFGQGALHFQSQARVFFTGFPVPILAVYRSEERARAARDVFASATAEVMVKPGGHWPHHEHPDEVVAAIAAWSAARVRAPSHRG